MLTPPGVCVLNHVDEMESVFVRHPNFFSSVCSMEVALIDCIATRTEQWDDL